MQKIISLLGLIEIKKWFQRTIIFLVFLAGLTALVKYSQRHELRSGLREERTQLRPNEHYTPAKTLWDWLQLFGAPVALAVIAYLFQQATKNADQKLAIENQRHSILQAYFDGMSQLLSSEGWDHEIWKFRRYGAHDGRGSLQQLVRARTLMVLNALSRNPPDQKRRGEVVRFLLETRLIQTQALGPPALIDLAGADLRGVSLERADLSNADLTGVDLRGADLRWANLKGIRENAISKDASYRSQDVHTTQLDPKWLLVAELLRVGASFKNLANKDLSCAYLVEANLSSANLSGADLRSSFLSKSSLTFANLKGANLGGAVLDYAELGFSKMNLWTRLDGKWKLVWKIASVEPARTLIPLVANADLSNATLRNSNLPEAVFVSADLSNTTFDGSTLAGSVFKKDTRILSTSFKEAKLARACFEGHLMMVNFSSAELGNAIFTKASLFFCNLDSAMLVKSNFCDAELTDCDLRSAKLCGADLSRSKHQGVNLSAADLSGANLQGVEMTGVDLSGAILQGANLTGAKLESVNLAGANLANAILRDAHISEEELRKAGNVEGAILP